MKTTQNQLNKYFDKVKSNDFEERNNIKQTEKQIEKKEAVVENWFNKFCVSAKKLTEEQYWNLENVEDLCIEYSEL